MLKKWRKNGKQIQISKKISVDEYVKYHLYAEYDRVEIDGKVLPLAFTLGFVLLQPLYWLLLAALMFGYISLAQVVKNGLFINLDNNNWLQIDCDFYIKKTNYKYLNLKKQTRFVFSLKRLMINYYLIFMI
jgi:hypothetical protein